MVMTCHKLSFLVQVRSSPQAKVFFATMCHEEGLKPLELIKWIRTRWGSMYDLVDRMLTNRAVCDANTSRLCLPFTH
jgi:hypothetical protein